MNLTRRDSLKLPGLGAGALLLPGGGVGAASAVPRYEATLPEVERRLRDGAV